MGRLLSWLEFRAWMEKITVTVCTWCDMVSIDCGILTSDQDADDAVTGPILDPSTWPPELPSHDQE